MKSNYWLQAILNSYSLIFFSLNNVLAVFILLVTFFSPAIGLSGLVAVVLINCIAFLMGFSRDDIKSGLIGFNALFLGLAMGYDFEFNPTFWFLFVIAIFTLLLITVWLKGVLAIYGLPFLSFPFIFTYWIISLAAFNFSNIHLDEKHLYAANELTRNQSSAFFQLVHSLDAINLPSIILTFFKTLAGAFFQSSVLGGMLIALGLLYFSRIAFSLSVLAYLLAYFFYNFFGADINDLNYNLVGSNFIFLAIGLGCFFIIPNLYSYVVVIILIPVLMLVMLFLGKIFGAFQLKTFSLSFSVLTTAFLFVLHQRWFHKYLQIVTLQYFSAEKTIYKFLISEQRFKNEHLYKVSLPTIGEWNISQGYDGKITHLGDWSKALDFVIVDSKNNTYFEPTTLRQGFAKENFYCYNKEIVAPYDGFVYDIINTIDDNDVGEVNTEHNWGNTIILNHLNGLFSQISHVKKDSFAVVTGQYVYKGTYLASCGNSGRSPEPHIHFQFQTLPTIGAKTLAYPISYFIERQGNEKFLRVSQVPKENSFVSNVVVNEILIRAFSFFPGNKLKFKNEKTEELIYWEVFTDAYNKTYIHCSETNSQAYFVNDGTMVYFSDFEGDKDSLLFHFYLATYRALLGYYSNVEVQDNIPLIHFNQKWVQFFQDFVAPFYQFTKANFKSNFVYTDNVYAPQHLIINSVVEAKVFNLLLRKINFELELKNGILEKFTIHHKNKSSIYTQITD